MSDSYSERRKRLIRCQEVGEIIGIEWKFLDNELWDPLIDKYNVHMEFMRPADKVMKDVIMNGKRFDYLTEDDYRVILDVASMRERNELYRRGMAEHFTRIIIKIKDEQEIDNMMESCAIVRESLMNEPFPDDMV